MKFFAYLFRLYLKSSIHIALAVCSLLYVSMKSHHINYEHQLFQFAFFGSIIAYNFIKYGLEVKRYIISSRKVMLPLIMISVVAAVMTVLSLFKLTYAQLLLVLAMGILIYLYTIPFIPSWSNFRNLARIKIYIVALVWVGVTVLLPLIDYWDSSMVLELIQRFILVMVLMIPFEIRDLNYDDTSLKTLAQIYGITGVKVLGVILILFWLLIGFYLKINANSHLLSVSLLLTVVLFFAKKDQKRFYTEFWVESIPIFYALLYTLSLNN